LNAGTNCRLLCFVASIYALSLLSAGRVHADGGAGDPNNGKTQFGAHCATCHSEVAGENRTGPYLFGVIGRRAGTATGYAYTSSFVQAGANGLIWSPDNLLQFLQNPSKFLQTFLGQQTVDNRMTVKFPDQQLRLDVIAYLSTLH
jgi:cytochrome c2